MSLRFGVPAHQSDDWINVKSASYGAVGDDTADDTTAIQAAIAAAGPGGTVYLPAGTYRLTSALTLASGVSIIGASPSVSVLHQTSTDENCLLGEDVGTVAISGVQLQGPGSGAGTGIKLTRDAEPNTRYLSIRDVYIRQFGQDGIDVSNCIVSEFARVVAENCGRYGIYLHGDGAAGTSVSLVSCYGNTNTSTGIYLLNMAYSSLAACASEGQPTNYLLEDCQGVSVSGCGSEVMASGGTGFKIDGGFANSLMACWDLTNRGKAYWLTGGTYAINLVGIVENSPGAGATASLQVDAGCAGVNLHAISNTTAMSLAAGTTNILNDGGNGLTLNGGYVYLEGTGFECNSPALFDQSARFFGNVGFYGAAVAAQPTVTGSRGGNAALASLLTGLATLGLVVDSTSA